MTQIIPAILEKAPDRVIDKVKQIENLGLKAVHLDAMDGNAVRNFCWYDIETMKVLLSDHDLDLEVHLMVTKPEEQAWAWLETKNVFRVILRSEAIQNKLEVEHLIRRYGHRIGISSDPQSSLSSILKEYSNLQYLLVMGVQSGYSGQEFKLPVLTKIQLAKKYSPKIKIGVDGGMNQKTILMVKKYGVDVINTASYFWENNKAKVISEVES